ncbi:MAG: sugar porter family MFS transporter, partial [Phycisphaerae bacterium]|nr:sugar porter family MFS transporter [Phycisphaerae bacterium]
AAVGGLLFGFDTAIIAGATEFIKDQFHLTKIQEGNMVGSLLIGCMIGAGVAGWLSDRFGRKRVLVVTAAIYVVSAILTALPKNIDQLMVTRFICGLAVGISSMIAPLYIAEIAPAKIRGLLVSLQQLAIVIGILLAGVVAAIFVDHGVNNWRFMFASAAVPSLLLLIGLFAVPESPRWLAKQAQAGQASMDQAFNILARIGGRVHATTELAEIQQALSKKEGSLTDLLSIGRVALIIGMTLAILGQISGINAVIYFAPKIFLAAGFDDASAAVKANIYVGVTNLIFTLLSMAVIDKMGRKALLIIGTAGMALAMVLAGTYLSREDLTLTTKVSIILFYTGSFSFGVGGVVWVLIAEIFPALVRSRGCAVATVAVWGACYLVALTFPWLLDTFKNSVFFIYAAMSLAMLLFVALVVPETKGKSLEEIDQMWQPRGH